MGTGRIRRLARLGVAAGAVSVGLAFSLAQSTQPTTSRIAALVEPGETVDHAIQRLRPARGQPRSRQEIALRTALEFARALGNADGRTAASLIEVVGFQPLPPTGPLPEQPDKPLPLTRVQEWVGQRPRRGIARAPAETFEVLTQTELRRRNAAAAEWMLPDDLAVWIRPSVIDGESWLARECYLIVRLRAGRPTILGGDVFDCLR